ncbi:MAG: DeoR/GlpR transcriptional regulator [Candidatus Carbobacillus altaicus]|nr:DeoR/GlpR transcriptional regulator [Candidatus Carbobacillus altaicus]
MLPHERLQHIREKLLKEKHLKISALSKEFGVSEMTIHRDIKKLLAEGIAEKTFGGVRLTPAKTEQSKQKNGERCILCEKTVDPKLAYRLILKDGTIETACCAHCGLIRHKQIEKEVSDALVHDFLLHTTGSTTTMTFVVGSLLPTLCCQPQILAFQDSSIAERFTQGFQGKKLSFLEALDFFQYADHSSHDLRHMPSTRHPHHLNG